MKKVADISAYIFIAAVALLSVVSILGVWDFFDGDVIIKSFQSAGLLAVVAVIIIVAEHFIEKKEAPLAVNAQGVAVPSSDELIIFKSIRIMTVTVLIAGATLLALFGVLSIWEVLSKEVFGKSVASIAIVAFSSLVILVTCFEREDSPLLHKKNFSGVAILVFIVAIWLLMASISSIF